MYRCYKGKLNVNQFWELQTRVQYLQADKRKKRFPLQCLHSVVLDQQMVYSRDFWLMLNDSPCVQLPLCAHRSRRSQKKPPITRYYIVVFANINVYSNTFFLWSGINDPQTVFTLVVVTVTIVLFVLRVCFGMFKRFGPHKEPLTTDAEHSGADVYIPEAYLPPVLQTTREMKGSRDDVSPPQLTRRKTYGSTQNDHVIDTSQLTPSSETVLTFADEDKQ